MQNLALIGRQYQWIIGLTSCKGMCMLHVLLIFVGGGAGAVCRHMVGLGGLRLFGAGFPVGTFAVNVFGSLLMGLLIGYLSKRGGSNELRLLLTTGFLGGFTTFSAFSLDVANLWTRGEVNLAIVYAALSVLLSIFAVFLGLYLMRNSAV